MLAFPMSELVQAYLDCRRTKRNSAAALAFEQNLERNLCALADDLRAGRWQAGPSICFVITRPKPREVMAAQFRDRIVHHLAYNHIAPRFTAGFIVDSCACIPGRGTLYAVERLERHARSQTQGSTKPAWYLKCDIANFFVSIDKRRLLQRLARKIDEPAWLDLVAKIIFHDPRPTVIHQSRAARRALIPPHKSLFTQPANRGLPIGNLFCQFSANVYLDALDQFVKHRIKARHYVRYVDDFVLLHEDPDWLNAARDQIAAFLEAELDLRLNDRKTVLQPVARGIDFAGQLIKPWHRILRRRTFNDALARLAAMPDEDLFESANSYFGLLRQATHSHHDRARLGRLLLLRGHAVNQRLTQTYRRTNGR